MNINLMDFVNIPYSICTIIFTYLILWLVINTQKQGIKILVSIISGVIIGCIFYYIVKFTDLSVLITSFFVSIVAYEWGIKRILDFFNISPDNNIGIKI